MQLLLVGASIAVISTVVAFSRYRKPGIARVAFAHIWKANEYLTPAGAALWIGGWILGVVLAGASLLTQP